MGQQPNELTPDAGPWHRWGYELRQFREARLLSQQALARRALMDRSHLGRFERAERPVPKHAAIALDGVLDAAGALVRGWDSAEREAPRIALSRCPEPGQRLMGPAHGAMGPAARRPWP